MTPIEQIREAQDAFNKAWNDWSSSPSDHLRWMNLLDMKALFNERVRNMADSLLSSMEGQTKQDPRDELIEELVAALAWQLQITADLNNEGMHIEHEFLSEALTKANSHGYGKPPMTP